MLTYGIASDKQLAGQPISACSPSLQPRTGEIQAGERQLHIVIRKAEMGKLKYFAVLEKDYFQSPRGKWREKECFLLAKVPKEDFRKGDS